MQIKSCTSLLVLLVLCLMLGASAVRAQSEKDDPISPERPGFTNGTDTVPPGHVQFETGYTFSHESGTRQHALGDQSTLRLSVTRTFEARLGIPPAYQWLRDESGMRTSGLQDTNVSVKYRFREADDKRPALPALAFIGTLELPTGARAFRVDDAQPTGAVEADWKLTDRYSLTADVVYGNVRQNHLRYDEWSGGLDLEVTLSPRWGTFAEVYRISDSAPGDTHVNYFDTGITYRVGANTIFDLNGGVNLAGAQDSYFVGGGIARRW